MSFLYDTRRRLFVIAATAYYSTRVILLALFRAPKPHLQRFVQKWAAALLADAGVRLVVEGRDRIPANQAFVVMSNHRSHYDTPCIMQALGFIPAFIAKKELSYIPFLGQAMRAFGMIFIDRGHSDAAHASLDRAADRVRGGDTVLMFPEGTRSKDGHTLGTFKKGGFHLAKRAGMPILPIAVMGSERVLPKYSLRIRPGEVTVRIGAPIPVEPDAEVGELRDATRRAIEELLAVPPAPRP